MIIIILVLLLLFILYKIVFNVSIDNTNNSIIIWYTPLNNRNIRKYIIFNK